MGRRGPKSKYSDDKATALTGDLLVETELRRHYREHAVDLPDERAFTPGRGPGLLAIKSGGDWSWQPARNSLWPQFGMPAYRATIHPRACHACGLTSCLSTIHPSSFCA